MLPINPIYTANMAEPQRAWFYAEYEQARKDEFVGVLLALLLGTFGLHHFYLRRNGLGILYLCFFWTGITAILGFVECFLMPGRVRDYNSAQAAFIAAQILAYPPSVFSASDATTSAAAPAAAEPAVFHFAGSLPTTKACASCTRPVDPAATYCPHCGAAQPPQK